MEIATERRPYTGINREGVRRTMRLWKLEDRYKIGRSFGGLTACSCTTFSLGFPPLYDNGNPFPIIPPSGERVTLPRCRNKRGLTQRTINHHRPPLTPSRAAPTRERHREDQAPPVLQKVTWQRLAQNNIPPRFKPRISVLCLL